MQVSVLRLLVRENIVFEFKYDFFDLEGTMRDAFSNFSQPYFWPYIIFGSLIVIGGAILFLIPVLKRQKERH